MTQLQRRLSRERKAKARLKAITVKK